MLTKLLENNIVLKECIEALQVDLLPEHESDKMAEIFVKWVPMTRWGKVDWKKINKKIEIGYDVQLLIPMLAKLIKHKFSTSVYIEWSSTDNPIIKTDLKDIISNFDKVICVDFEKFIFNLSEGYIIEVLPSGLITAGIIPVYDN